MQNSQRTRETSKLEAKACQNLSLKGKLFDACPRVVVMERRAQIGLSKGPLQERVFCFRFLSVNEKLSQEKLERKGKLCRCLPTRRRRERRPQIGHSKGPAQDGVFVLDLSPNEKRSFAKFRKRETSKPQAKPDQNLISQRETFRCFPTRCRKGAESPNWARQGSPTGRGFLF